MVYAELLKLLQLPDFALNTHVAYFSGTVIKANK